MNEASEKQQIFIIYTPEQAAHYIIILCCSIINFGFTEISNEN